MYSMNWLLYNHYPNSLYKMYTADDVEFFGHDIMPMIQDLDTPDNPAR